jgi:hypothetical protein
MAVNGRTPKAVAIAPASLGANGTINPWALPTHGTYSSVYQSITLQKAYFGITTLGPVVIAILNGTAAAAGTLAIVTAGSAPSANYGGPTNVSVDFTVPGRPRSGLEVTGAGGIQLKNLAAAAGTVTGFLTGIENCLDR